MVFPEERLIIVSGFTRLNEFHTGGLPTGMIPNDGNSEICVITRSLEMHDLL